MKDLGAYAADLREQAAATDDEDERERLLGAAAEADGVSLNGAAFARPAARGNVPPGPPVVPG